MRMRRLCEPDPRGTPVRPRLRHHHRRIVNSLPDISSTKARLRQHLAEIESCKDEDGSARAGCSEDLLIPLRAARAEANRILLAE